MSKSEQPLAGQWWLTKNRNVTFIAFDARTIGNASVCPILVYYGVNNPHWRTPDEFVRRLPDDAGFDYKPEPEYPQYWTTIDCGHDAEVAYVVRTGPSESGDWHCVMKDGAVRLNLATCKWKQFNRRRLTKEEAETLVIKPKSIPEIVFDPKTFTSDWGPFQKPSPDRWFIWSDNRYPIAFVKHADGTVQNLNVDLILKQSDDWNQGYEDQLTNGELVEVTEFSAKAFLKRPRSASQIPKHEPPKPNRIPVRLYWYYGNVVACFAHSPPTDPSFVEIKLDPQMIISGSGFYVEGRIA